MGPAGTEADGTGGEQPVADHRTYYIGESVKFDGGGRCEGDDLNTVTRRLRRRLDRAGWTGLRLVDDDTWPEDLWDAALEPLGLDDGFADAHRLAVYAGHGLPGKLQWGRPSPEGKCMVDIPVHARLGRLAGDTAAAVMLLTSCTLRTDVLWPNFGENAARQVFGYHDSPHVAGRELRDVFKRTQDGQSTKDAWLDEMEKNLAPGRNSPVVFTAGVDGAEAMAVHGATNLATGAGLVLNVGEPADAFFFEWLDNGCTPRCGGCSRRSPEGSSVPSMQIGSTVPIVELRRPHRSIDELVGRASVLVALVQGRPLSTAQRVQLEAWAQRVAHDRDLVVAVLEGEPTVQVFYDPSIDHLVVDDLDARRSARPAFEDEPELEREDADLERARAERDRVLEVLDAQGLDLLGVPRGSTFSVGSRKAGLIVGGVTMGEVAFETMFSTFGEFGGVPVFGAELEIGITRDGELSRLSISAVRVTELATATVRRSLDEALEQLERDVAARNPQMLRHEVVSARIGFLSPEGPSQAALVAPEVAVDYVVIYPGGDLDPMVSRRYPARVSLINDSSSRPRHEAEGVSDDVGDERP